METWKSPRRINEEINQAWEEERRKAYEAFDSLMEYVDQGIMTMEELEEIMHEQFNI